MSNAIDPGKGDDISTRTPMPGDIAARIIQRVAELPDRNSPEDWPDAMLVTGEELQFIIGEEIVPLAEETMRLYRELGASKENLRFMGDQLDTAIAERDDLRSRLASAEVARIEAMNESSVMVEDVETAERIADTMRDLVDDMTTEVQRLRVRTARAFWGAVVTVGLLAGMQLWRAWA